MSTYKGMKWYKCDLQMQTPGDRYNWLQNDPAFLPGEYSQGDLIRSVDMYLHRCHEIGLELIGVTDHNFIGRNYLEMLQRRNAQVANDLGKEPIIIFPGFEIEIAQGLGVHLLCLFDPETPLDEIDDLVTQLGLPKARRVVNGSIEPVQLLFNEILETVQNHDRIPGLIIAAHPLSESGLLNDNFITDRFQREMFTDPRLLAIEIPKNVDALTQGWQRLLKAGPDCHPDWRRNRPIATVQSSDCYSLTENEKGFIGKRHTWLKLSRPSIDSLRQAFLDHESRIRHQLGSPDRDQLHGKIKSLKVQNVAFLEDQEIQFSPNLNCLIGGRGSGKSTVLEYIRLCTRNDDDDKASDQISRVKNTLLQESKLVLEWENRTGLIDTFEFSTDHPQAQIVSREGNIVDPATIFRQLGIQLFSQRQISNMAQDVPSLLPLIDNLCGEDLDALIDREKRIKDQIRQLQQKNITKERLLNDRKALEQEISELDRQWDAFTTIQEGNEKRQAAKRSETFLEQLHKGTEDLLNEYMAFADKVLESVYEQLSLEEGRWLYPDSIIEFVTKINEFKTDVSHQIRESAQKSIEKLEELTKKDPKWITLKQKVEETETEFQTLCEQQGLRPEELDFLKDVDEKRIKKIQLKNQIDDELIMLIDEVEQLPVLFYDLHGIWRQQSDLRQSCINEILYSDVVPKVPQTGQPFIEVEIDYFGDDQTFKSIWESIRVKRTTRLGRIWDELGNLLFVEFKQKPGYASPWQLLNHWMEDASHMPGNYIDHYDSLKKFIKEEILTEWLELQLHRASDGLDITLYRNDGTRAGSLKDKGLSDGQKNTAILTILFARGTDPIIIDQPEDELDSAFIYNELVPLLRNVKNKRQVILTTHNANLPVNGDAELVYALTANQGRGEVRAQGGLDHPEVRDAILDIMEGSEEAFRRRREKYHF